MKKACFFSNEGLQSILIQQYSIQDINILKDLGYDVIIASKISEIPWNVDLYFSWWGGGSILPLIVAKLTKKPIIVVAGGNEVLFYKDSITQEVLGYLSAAWYKKIAVRLVLKYADELIVVSKFMEREIKQLTLRSVNLAYNSIDVDKFYDTGNKRKYITSIFNFEQRVFSLKRGEVFLRAIPYVLNVFPSQKFLIIGGDIEKYPDVKLLIDSLNIKHAVKILTKISNKEISSWLNQSIAYVQISDTETFGVTVAEAMSTQTPVVVSKKGALPEVVGDCGEYVDHNCPKSVSSGIIKMIKGESVSVMGERSRDRIISKFSYNHRKKILDNIIKKITG